MNIRNIKAVMHSRGIAVMIRSGETGPELGINLPGGEKALVGSIPIDDDSDMRFCDFMEKQYRGYVADYLKAT